MQIPKSVNKFLDIDSFKQLNTGKKIAVGGLTALVALTGVGILAAPLIFKSGVWLSKKLTPMKGSTRTSQLAAKVLNKESAKKKEVEEPSSSVSLAALFKKNGQKPNLEFDFQMIDGNDGEKQIIVYTEGKEDTGMELKPSEKDPSKYHLILPPNSFRLILPSDEDVETKWAYTEKQAACICYLLHYPPEGLKSVPTGDVFKDTGFILLQDGEDPRRQFSVNEEGQLQEIDEAKYFAFKRAMENPAAFKADQQMSANLKWF
ncbi:MAG: hypothetical protein ACSNEK_08310 [Parachlamydiaceae bacterium]